jgi:SAM-dependent methyltransferase
VLNYIVRSTPIHEFLTLCEAAPLERTVLDCGAGGKYPPLTLFQDRGYATYGIEISPTQLRKADSFGRHNAVELSLCQADMRQIPFKDGAFSFVFAYESFFFLTRRHIGLAMREIERVLKPQGLCLITFRSVDDTERRSFPPGHPVRTMLGSKALTYFEDDEPAKYFRRFTILRKQKRIRKTRVKGQIGQRAYIDYIARKR